MRAPGLIYFSVGGWGLLCPEIKLRGGEMMAAFWPGSPDLAFSVTLRSG